MALLPLLTLFVAPLLPEDALELQSIYPRSDPLALAVSEDEEHLFLASGCVIAVHALSEEEPVVSAELRHAVVDASILDLACDGPELFIAGGSQGVYRVAWREPDLPVTFVDRVESGACLAVTTSEERLLAAFATSSGPILRTYSRATLEQTDTVKLPAGLPHDVEARGDRAWLALGEGGVAEVRFHREGETEVQLLPGPVDLPSPEGFELPVGYVRDLALGPRYLHAAADIAGLFSYDLREEGAVGRRTPVLRRSGERGPSYAVRVAARGRRVAVGTLRGPAQVAEGAPYSATGAIGLELEVGAIAREAYPLAREEELILFEQGDGELREVGRCSLPRSGWRNLELGRERIFEQHLKIGTIVREIDERGPGRELFQSRPRGLPLIDGVLGLLHPELVFFGHDSEGSLVRGIPEIRLDGELGVAPWSRERRGFGMRVGAQWIDPAGGSEWFVVGWAQGWTLNRLEGTNSPRLSSWPLPPPVDPEGAPGATYFGSIAHGDLLLATRSGSRFGLLGWSITALTEAASEVPVGEALEVAPLFQLRTHTGGAVLSAHTWRAAILETPGGSTLAVAAAGRELEGENRGRSRALVVELSGTDRPQIVAELLGEASQGHADCVAVANLRGSPVAFVGGFEGRLELWDLSTARAPRRVGSWSAPPSPIDGRSDALLDLDLVGEGDRLQLLIAASRLGLVRLDLSQPGGAELFAAEILDTPGWAAGLATQRRGAVWRILLGDQKGGARLYRWSPSVEREK